MSPGDPDGPDEMRILVSQLRKMHSILKPMDVKVCEELQFVRSQSMKMRETYDRVQSRLHQTREELQDAEVEHLELREELERVSKDHDRKLKSQGVLQRKFITAFAEARKEARDRALQRPLLGAMDFQAIEDNANGSTMVVDAAGGGELPANDMPSLCDQYPGAAEFAVVDVKVAGSVEDTCQTVAEGTAFATSVTAMTSMSEAESNVLANPATPAVNVDSTSLGPGHYKMPVFEPCYKSARPPPQVTSGQLSLQSAAWQNSVGQPPPMTNSGTQPSAVASSAGSTSPHGVCRRSSGKIQTRSLSAGPTPPSTCTRISSAPTLALLSKGAQAMPLTGSALLSNGSSLTAQAAPLSQVSQTRSPTQVRRAKSPRSHSPVMNPVQATPSGLSPVAFVATSETSPPKLGVSVSSSSSTSTARLRTGSPRLASRVSPVRLPESHPTASQSQAAAPKSTSPSQQQRRSPRIQTRTAQRTLPSYAFSPRSAAAGQASSMPAIPAIPSSSASSSTPASAAVLATAPSAGRPASYIAPARGSNGVADAAGSSALPSSSGTASVRTGQSPSRVATAPGVNSWASVSAAAAARPRSPRPTPKVSPRPVASPSPSLAGPTPARAVPVQRTDHSPRPRGSASPGAIVRRQSPHTRSMARTPGGTAD